MHIVYIEQVHPSIVFSFPLSFSPPLSNSVWWFRYAVCSCIHVLRGSDSFTISPTLVVFFCLLVGILMGVGWYVIVVLICISPVINNNLFINQFI
jgi:hypothetical protein